MSTVLVAHDAEAIREVIRSLLTGAGHQVIAVATGKQAVGALVKKPDAVVLDVAVAEVLAFEVVDEVRRRLEKCKIILIASIYNRTSYKRRPTSLYGADDYVEQHHIPDALLPKLTTLLGDSAPSTAPLMPPPHADTPEGRSIRAAGEERLDGAERTATSGQDWIERAERLARVLVADIALYNGDALEEARRGSGNLSARLRTDLEEGRLLFDLRIPKEVRANRDFITEALDALVRSSG